MRLTTALTLVAGWAGLAALASAKASPQVPVPPGAQARPTLNTTYPPALYQMNDVSKSLNLTADQMTNLNKLTEQTQSRYRDDYAKLSTMAEADRFARTQELNRLYSADWNKGTRDILNDTQRNRYQQLYNQYNAFDALHDPNIQKQLNLTPEQVKDLRSHYDWNMQQLRDIHRAAEANAAKGTSAYEAYWTQRNERLDKFLTPDQQKAWRGLTGDPYRFQSAYTPPKSP